MLLMGYILYMINYIWIIYIYYIYMWNYVDYIYICIYIEQHMDIQYMIWIYHDIINRIYRLHHTESNVGIGCF